MKESGEGVSVQLILSRITDYMDNKWNCFNFGIICEGASINFDVIQSLPRACKLLLI